MMVPPHLKSKLPVAGAVLSKELIVQAPTERGVPSATDTLGRPVASGRLALPAPVQTKKGPKARAPHPKHSRKGHQEEAKSQSVAPTTAPIDLGLVADMQSLATRPKRKRTLPPRYQVQPHDIMSLINCRMGRQCPLMRQAVAKLCTAKAGARSITARQVQPQTRRITCASSVAVVVMEPMEKDFY